MKKTRSQDYLWLWSNTQQIEAENVGVETSHHGTITKHADTSTLWKLTVLIIQILCRQQQTYIPTLQPMIDADIGQKRY